MKNYRSLYRKEIEWLSLAKKYAEKNDINGYVFNARGAIIDLFYNSENLKSEFVDLIPTAKLASVRNTLDFLRFATGNSKTEWSGHRGTKLLSSLLENIKAIEKIVKEQLSLRSNFSIFYSWQSDLCTKYNRNFIEHCLTNAVTKYNENSDIKINIDKDTKGEAGSPDIVNVIFHKIDNALGFIADITPIVNKKSKLIPNPNVMLELGYAFSSLTDERVVLICNTANGKIRDLPFDLGLKRIICYYYDENTELENKKKQKDKLENSFYEAIKAIVEL